MVPKNEKKKQTKHGTCTIYIYCSLCISFSVFCTDCCLWGQMCLSTTTAGNVCLFDSVYLILKTVGSVDLLDSFCIWSTAFVVVSCFSLFYFFFKVPPSSIVFAQSLTCEFFFYSFWWFWSFTSNCTESRLKVLFGGRNQSLLMLISFPTKNLKEGEEVWRDSKVFFCLCRFLADFDCPWGERGLNVWYWGGDGGAVDVWSNWGGEGRGNLGLEGAGHGRWWVGGGDGGRRIGGVDRWGVAGSGRRGVRRNWRGIGSDGRGVAGGGWSSWHRRGRHCHSSRFLRFLVLLPQVYFCVPLPLITAGKLAAADLAGEGFLPSVSADVSCQVVTAAEVAHADATLERLLARVDANVAGQFVWARKASIARLHGASVGPLMRRGFAWPGGVLTHAAGFN